MPTTYEVRVHPSSEDLPRSQQLAWHLAELATTEAPVTDEVADMVINRVIDNAAVATARSEEHTSELQSRGHLVCRLLLEKKHLYAAYRGTDTDSKSKR